MAWVKTAMLGRAQHSLLGQLRRAQAVTDAHATKRPCQRRCRMPRVRTGHYLRHTDEHLWKNMGLTRLTPDSLAILIPIVSRENPIGTWCPICDNEVAETFSCKRRDCSPDDMTPCGRTRRSLRNEAWWNKAFGVSWSFSGEPQPASDRVNDFGCPQRERVQ